MLVFSNTKNFQEYLMNEKWEGSNLLLMSSGNYDGLQVKAFAEGLNL
jgi:hypothetical protein